MESVLRMEKSGVFFDGVNLLRNLLMGSRVINVLS